MIPISAIVMAIALSFPGLVTLMLLPLLVLSPGLLPGIRLLPLVLFIPKTLEVLATLMIFMVPVILVAIVWTIGRSYGTYSEGKLLRLCFHRCRHHKHTRK